MRIHYLSFMLLRSIRSAVKPLGYENYVTKAHKINVEPDFKGFLLLKMMSLQNLLNISKFRKKNCSNFCDIKLLFYVMSVTVKKTKVN